MAKTIKFSNIEIEAILNALYSMPGKDFPEGELLRATIRVEKKLMGVNVRAADGGLPFGTLAGTVTRKRESGEWKEAVPPQ